MSKENMFLNVLVEFSAFLADSTSVLSFSVIGKVVCFSFFSTVKHLVATLTLPVTQGLEFGNGFEVLVFNKLKVIFFFMSLIWTQLCSAKHFYLYTTVIVKMK